MTMIRCLHIKNLATIQEVEIELEPGFLVLTGETGAGKSVVIESIRLALGDKGSTDVIRTGADETSIQIILEQDCASSDAAQLLIHRRIPARGSSRCYLDGNLIPLRKISEIGGRLVDIYGQNDHVFLREVQNQLDYLDRYAGVVELRGLVAKTAAEVRRLFRRKQQLSTSEHERKRRQDFLVFQLQEIEKARLKPDEEETLRQERLVLKNAERIKQWLEEALELAYSRDQSLSVQLAQLLPLVERLGEFDDECKNAFDSLQSFAISLKELSHHLIRFREKQQGSPERLEELENRLSQIESLKRKYGGSIKEVLDYYRKCQAEFADLNASEEKLGELDEELRQRFDAYSEYAARLRTRRLKAAKKLKEEIEREIGQLGMKKARFSVDLRKIHSDPARLDLLSDSGTEEVEFLLSPNPGEDLKPLRKIASGGELSRFMLALKSVDNEAEESRTLIFDEIDAGIGGKTAEFLARKLLALSRRNQVICITHLPQIASYATHHIRIDKNVKRNRTFTTVHKLSPQERVEEIARLLAGSRVTSATLKSAQEMLELKPQQDRS
jgi:DNA repair protein RecN (Recombination protein N)